MARFDSIRFKVHKADDQLDRAFPELFRIPEFQKLRLRPNWEKVVKYICFLYDPDTDLAQEFQSDLTERKEAAAVEAGFTRDDRDKWPEDLRRIMAIKDEDVHAAIIAFLRIFNNHEWTDIVVTEQEIWEFQALRFKAIEEKDNNDLYGDAKKKDTLMAAVKDRRANLKVLYRQFYGDHEDLERPEFDEMITPENAERILATMPPSYEEERPDVSPN